MGNFEKYLRVGMGNFEKYLRFADDLTNGTHSRFRTKAELAEFAGIAPSQVKKYQTASDMKNIEKFFAFLDKLGVNLDFEPNPEPNRDVCFVNARIAPIGEGVEPPQSEDYIAAPLVGEVGAGLGYIPRDVIEGWCLVSRNNPAVRSRSNLIAVEIGHSSYSMQPTLNPGDIVLVDKNDRNIQRCGHIMLVTDPEGAGMIKRVAINDKKDDDYRIIFYSDNNLQHPPLVYSLRNDYAGDWDKVVAGRVILALTDMRKK